MRTFIVMLIVVTSTMFPQEHFDVPKEYQSFFETFEKYAMNQEVIQQESGMAIKQKITESASSLSNEEKIEWLQTHSEIMTENPEVILNYTIPKEIPSNKNAKYIERRLFNLEQFRISLIVDLFNPEEPMLLSFLSDNSHILKVKINNYNKKTITLKDSLIGNYSLGVSVFNATVIDKIKSPRSLTINSDITFFEYQAIPIMGKIYNDIATSSESIGFRIGSEYIIFLKAIPNPEEIGIPLIVQNLFDGNGGRYLVEDGVVKIPSDLFGLGTEVPVESFNKVFYEKFDFLYRRK